MNYNNIDFSQDPRDNFYDFCNGKWIMNNKIPKKYSSWGTFESLFEENQNKITHLISNCKHNDKLNCVNIYNLYKTGIDYKKRNIQDLKYIEPFLDDIFNLKNKKDFIKLIGKFHKYDIDCLFNIYVNVDSKDSSINRLHFYHSFLGMPDKDYYLYKDFNNYKREYILYIKNLLNNIKIKYKIDSNYQKRIFDFEKKISEITISKELKRNPFMTYNKLKMNDSIKKFNTLDIESYFKVLNISPEYIIFDDIDFYIKLGKLISLESMDTLKEYLFFCLINSFSPYLSSHYEEQHFNFYGKILSGQKIQKTLKERITEHVNLYLDDAVGLLFVETYFNENSKIYVEDMVNNFKDTLKTIILKLEWMSNKTKKNALTKLKHISYKIGYPCKSTLKKYDKLIITNDSYVNNIINCKHLDFNFGILKIDNKVNKKNWYMSPQTINAYYSPNYNEIVFPASLLQKPFFSIEQSIPENYGGIGAIIGHEITHAFDDEGSKYNHKGILNNWWDSKDKQKFMEETNKMLIQYSNYKILNFQINSKLTLGENLADYGGIQISLLTMLNNNPNFNKEIKKKIKTIKSIDDFTSTQKFFISYANIWKSLTTKENTIKKIKTDPHSPNILRVNGPLSIIDEFHKSFDVDKKNKMFIEKNKRCNIWL